MIFFIMSFLLCISYVRQDGMEESLQNNLWRFLFLKLKNFVGMRNKNILVIIDLKKESKIITPSHQIF